ncbi:MAG: enoyl-CoA hydratase [Pseudomonadota bacterium]|nr:enoyl-CoA hydratase [Pseudomonadota bacterium]
MADRSSKSAGGRVDLLREDRGPIALLTLNRPEARNSLSEALMASLTEALADIGRSKQIRAVVLAAKGPIFCAGHDMKEMSAHRNDRDRGKAYFAQVMKQCAELMQDIMTCPKPVVAAVEETATAAGCQLVASCDLAVASEEAKFCTPGVHIGLFCSTPMVAISRNVPRKRIMEMLLLGEMVDAKDANAWGLVNRVVPKKQVLSEAMKFAETIASKSSEVVAIGKEAFYRQVELPVKDAYDHAAQVMVTNLLHRDSQEGIGAFLDKRKPEWGDR